MSTPLKITSVTTSVTTGNVTITSTFSPNPSTVPGQITTITGVKIQANHLLTVQGTATDGAVVCCTVVRQGREDKEEPHETIHRVTRCAKSIATKWSITFEAKHKGKYLVACHSGKQAPPNDYVEVEVAEVVGTDPNSSLDNPITMEHSYFCPNQIGGNGTVFYPGNPVTCTLTQINIGDGTTGLGGEGGTTPAPLPSQTALAVLDPTDPTGSSWSVSFAPPVQGQTFSGWYCLQASAANEGSVSATGEAAGC